ncbi:MAG TPA: hypothetical protein VI521_02570 [Candidatus Babeliales bacterium]|nr:hypothetical protein [Candidatus Babeliales bacterium]
MKKYIIRFLLLYSYGAIGQNSLTITQFCEQFHQRSYFILRLEQIIHSIQRHHIAPFPFQFNHEKFNNATILRCIQKIETTQSLQPFYTMWKDVKRYKYLEDQSFALDITKLLFSIQHTLYTQTKQNKEPISFDIDLYLKDSNYTEATTIRQYHVERLSDIFSLLKTIKCSQKSLFEEEHKDCDCTFITHHDFSNKSIRDCIAHIETQKSLDPLFELYEEFTHFKLIQDELFLREFTSLTFIVARNIFINNLKTPPTPLQKRRKSHIAHIYENLDKIPIEEILEAIDLLNKELPEILEKFEFNSDLSWKAWLKKYWWLPPTVGVIMALRIRWIFAHPAPSTGRTDALPVNPLLATQSNEEG